MTEIVRYMKNVHDCTQIKLGHRLENKIAESLYKSMGFEQAGFDGHEVIRRLVV